MSYEVIQPPETDESLRDTGREILEAAAKLGRPMDVEDFLKAWISGIKVILERNDAGEITGMAVVITGRRWLFQDYTASVLWMKCENRDGMIEYLKMMSNALGLSSLFIQSEEPLEESNKIARLEVIEHKLRA